MSAIFIKIFSLAIFIAAWGIEASAHETGAPFSGAFPEPILLHHAHIEDEQRLNLVGLSNHRRDDEEDTAFFSSVELAVAWFGGFQLGSEMFIPFSNTGSSSDDFGLGDIEIQPIKYAMLNQPERVLTGAFSLTLPTGQESRGLGGEQTTLGGLLFFDQAFGNWYLGINTEYASSVSGPTFSEFELAASFAYSFIQETGEGIAPAVPKQPLVLTLMLEMVSEFVLTGAENGENIVTLLPGIQFWHPKSDWNVKMGIGFPLTSDRENDVAGHLQVGNHFDWGQFFK